jgi:formate hydrogenlyase subunit 6/NADH:ubiquinone oxidoreductase subunit I
MSFFGMTKIVIKNLFSKPVTRPYPYVKREPFQDTRGKITVAISSCIFCTLCQKKCPTDAITVDKVDKKWTINRLRCIHCGACVEKCPKDCLTQESQFSQTLTQKGEETWRA